MKVLCFESECSQPPLTVPEIFEQLWRIADESRCDPVMQEFSAHVLVALDELVRLREAAHLIMQEATAAAVSTHCAADAVQMRGGDAPGKRQAVDAKCLADTSA